MESRHARKISETSIHESSRHARKISEISIHDGSVGPSSSFYSSGGSRNGNPIQLEIDARGPPFCGRQSELEHLMRIYQKVNRTKRAASVLVQGGPGCGKSHLIEAFQEKLWMISNRATPVTEFSQYDRKYQSETERKSVSSEKERDPRPEKEKNEHTWPPIFCSAKFEDGQAASSEAMEPIVACFSTITDTLLGTEESREFWKPILAEALQKDLPVLVPLIPSLQQLETTGNPSIPGCSTDGLDNGGDPPITPASGETRQMSHRRLAPPGLAKSQPAISSSRLQSETDKDRRAKSYSSNFIARLIPGKPILYDNNNNETSLPPSHPLACLESDHGDHSIGTDDAYNSFGGREAPFAGALEEGKRISHRRLAPPGLTKSQPVVSSNPLRTGQDFASNKKRRTKSFPAKLLSRFLPIKYLSPDNSNNLPLSPLPTFVSDNRRSLTVSQSSQNSIALENSNFETRTSPEMKNPIPSPLQPWEESVHQTSIAPAIKPSEPPRNTFFRETSPSRSSMNSVQDDKVLQQLRQPEPTEVWVNTLEKLTEELSSQLASNDDLQPSTYQRTPASFVSKGPRHSDNALDARLTPAENKLMSRSCDEISEDFTVSASRLQPIDQIQDMSMRSVFLRTKSTSQGFGAFSQRNVNHLRRPGHTRKTEEDSHSEDPDKNALQHSSVGKSSQKLDHEDYSVERAQYALRAYLRCVCKWRLVAFFLDDVQWAGREAISAFRAFLIDSAPSQRKFLFVAIHRPLPRGHEMVRFVYDLEEAVSKRFATSGFGPVPISMPEQIKLDSLKHKEIVELVSKVLKRDEEDVEPLAALIRRKTAGNCFFVVEFIQLLESKGHLYFSFADTRWEWTDLSEIDAQTEISDNVVNVVADTICEAPPNIKQALLMAAAMGSGTFSAEALKRAIPSDPAMKRSLMKRASNKTQLLDSEPNISSIEALESSLQKACKKRYVKSLGPSKFKFSHDRIREAAASLLPDKEEMDKLRLQIGRQLHSWFNEQLADGVYDEKLLLQVVIQLNLSSYLMENNEEKVMLSELNFAAAQSAIKRSSFFPASDFLRVGIDLLGENAWVDYYSQRIKLSDALMRMDYCCGRLAVSVELADEILQHAVRFDDKKMAYHIKILWLTQNEMIEEAIDLILKVLKELGTPVPRNFLRIHRILDWFRTAQMTKGLSEEKLLALPDATSEHIDNIGSFLERLEEVCLNGNNPRPHLLSVALLRVMQLTLKHGRFTMTPLCMVSWGWYHARAGRLDIAHKFGEFGVKLAKEGKGGYHDERAILMYYMHIYHWKTPYHDGLKPTTEALQKLWDLGAIEYVFLDTITYLRIYFCCGLRLESLAADIRKYVDLLKDYGHRLAFENHLAFFQCVESLIGEHYKETDRSFSGDIIEQEDLMADWEGRKYDVALQQAFFQRMMQAYFFTDIDLALEMSKNMWSPHDEGPDVFLPFRVFFMGMTGFSSYNLKKKVSHRIQGMKMLKQMKRWEKKGVVNVHHMLHLLQAECNAGSKMSFVAVRRSFDEAISKAGRCGFLHFQALANERAGIYCAKQDEQEWAKTYITQARLLYSDWGAFAKVRKMEEQYSIYLEGSTAPRERYGSDVYSKARLGDISKEMFKGLNTDEDD